MGTDITMKETGILRLGTRGSLLALHQTHLAKTALEQNYASKGLNCWPVIIKTQADSATHRTNVNNGTVGLFTKELEDALLKNEIDVAIHSLKDLPAELSPGLILGAVLPREDYRDVLISRHGLTLREMAERKNTDITNILSLATSSPRRKAQLLNFCNNFEIKELDGNVDTRLRKMENGYCDAMVLAAAGVKRIGMEHRITEYLEPDVCMPAAGQGIIALEIREDNTALRELLAPLDDPDTSVCARTERAFLKAIQGGCRLPLGCISYVVTQQLHLAAVFAHPLGEYVLKASLSGSPVFFEALANQLAEQLLQQGGTELQALIRNEL